MIPKNILHQRIIVENENSTVSQLTYEGKHIAIILEDGHRDQKVYGETRIPQGIYKLRKRTWGRHFDRYSKRYGHEFTVEIMDIPNFTNVLYHIGNFTKDTLGCPLVNTGFNFSQRSQEFYGIHSANAYKGWYDFTARKMYLGKELWVNIDRRKPFTPLK